MAMTVAAMTNTMRHAVANDIDDDKDDEDDDKDDKDEEDDEDDDAVNIPMISGAMKPGIVPKVLEMPVMMPA